MFFEFPDLTSFFGRMKLDNIMLGNVLYFTLSTTKTAAATTTTTTITSSGGLFNIKMFAFEELETRQKLLDLT